MCICPIICENLWWPFRPAPGGNLGPFRAPKMGILINCIRLLWLIWDLGLLLFDSPKDAVFGKIFVFCNILHFPGVYWAQKWTKTVNFRYIPFLPKHKILKDCYYTVFVLWKTTLVKISAKLSHIWGRDGPKKPKAAISWMLYCHEHFENL